MLALLFLFSCTRDYLMDSNDNKPVDSHSRVNRINFQKMENFILKNTQAVLPNSLTINNLNNKSENYITDIDTTDIIKVVHNGITSFTIKVNTLSDKDFTFANLVVNVHNGNIEEYIYHYKPEAQWLRDYIAGDEKDYNGLLLITDIKGNEITSTGNKTGIHSKNSTVCFVYMHIPCYGASCPCSDYNGTTYYINASCSSGGGGSTGGNPGGPPSGGSPGGGGGTVPSVPYDEQINNFIAFLSPSIHAYITQNPNSLTDINIYFMQNGVNPKRQSFINSILEYVEKKSIAWSTFKPIFDSTTAYKKQNPDSWTNISTMQDSAFDFMLQNSPVTWQQFQKWFTNPNIDSAISTATLTHLVETSHVIPNYKINDYPGMNDSIPFGWWNDDLWMKNNMRVDDLKPTEEPNLTELMLFSIYKYEAILHVKNSKNAWNTAQELVTNGTYTRIHNGKADAFRHTFWNALDASDFGNKITLLFTKAHKIGSGNHHLEKEMDLHNNNKGAEIGENYTITTPSSVIKTAVINNMALTTNIKYLNPLANHDGDNIITCVNGNQKCTALITTDQ